jgi:short-subunit dehydrogenase
MSIFKPVTVVTGASGGIGEALARVFAKNGHEVALVARREKEMILLSTELAVSCKYKPHVITADLQRSDAPARIAHELLGRGLEPAIVVNNAGFGLHGEAAELDRAEQLAMIDLNVRALTDLSLRWLDGIVRHKGGILNVASVAGFLPGPGMAVYYASKGYVLSFTEALSRELEPQGVRVTVLCPGPVLTEFQMRAGLDTKRPPRLLGRTVDEVAQAGYAGFMARKRVVIPGFGNKVVSFLPRLLPRGLVVRAIDSYQQGRGRRAEGWKKRAKP